MLVPAETAPDSRAGEDASQSILYFAPDAARAAYVDARVRAGLADSLETLFEALAGDFAIPRPALHRLILGVRERPTRPQVFALYADIVRAVYSNGAESIAHLLDALAAPALLRPMAARIVTLRDDHLGSGMAERYARIVDDDSAAPVLLEPPPDASFEEARANVMAALALLQGAAPEFAGEVNALARQIVLAIPPAGGDGFGGASTFYLWGAVFLNPSVYSTRLQMAEALVHETTHLLLFGMGMGEPLVQNPDDERYVSPLRSDPRPMEGIVHATYVIARIVAAMQRLAEFGGLSDMERTELVETRRAYSASYRDALGLIRRHARFTPVGEQVFASCMEAFPG